MRARPLRNGDLSGTPDASRTPVETELASVDFICIDESHVQRGRGIPDTYGALTLNGRQWAYCSAALGNAPHDWKATGGVEFAAIRHAELPRFPPPDS
jgi:hypothetical protein